jgi:hypothetical protein
MIENILISFKKRNLSDLAEFRIRNRYRCVYSAIIKTAGTESRFAMKKTWAKQIGI